MPDKGGDPIENVSREQMDNVWHVITDVAILGDTTNHPISLPKNTIYWLQSYLREAIVGRGAVVSTVDYEGMYQRGSRSRGKRARDNPQLVQMVDDSLMVLHNLLEKVRHIVNVHQ